jgi:hypothetical protein
VDGEDVQRVRERRVTPSSRMFYTPTGRLSWPALTKLVSGAATAVGLISFVVSLGIRYGELKTTVETQTKVIEELKEDAREQGKKTTVQVDRLTYALKSQADVIIHLRIAVAAIAAVDDARRLGRYDRAQVLGSELPATVEDVEITKRPVQQARLDAQLALRRARQSDPRAALKQLEVEK